MMLKLPTAAVLVLCMGLFGAPPLLAANALDESAVAGAVDFAEQRAEIERDLADGETYSEISPENRTEVRAALDRMGASLGATGSVDGMSDRAKTQLFNDQELVNNILTEAEEDSRMVCERRVKTGSNRKISICMTVAERRRSRERAQDTFNNNIRASGEFRPGLGP